MPRGNCVEQSLWCASKMGFVIVLREVDVRSHVSSHRDYLVHDSRPAQRPMMRMCTVRGHGPRMMLSGRKKARVIAEVMDGVRDSVSAGNTRVTNLQPQVVARHACPALRTTWRSLRANALSASTRRSSVPVGEGMAWEKEEQLLSAAIEGAVSS